MNKIHKGFTAVEVLIIIAIVGIVTALGIVLYDRLNTDEDSVKSSTSLNESNESQDKKDVGIDNSEEAAIDDVQYLEITELGVKLKLPDNIGQLYYEISDNKYAYISLEEFRGTNCAADRTAPIAVIRNSEADFDYENDAMAHSKKERSKKIGEYYYYSMAGQATCSDDPATQAKSDSVRSQISAIPAQSYLPIQ